MIGCAYVSESGTEHDEDIPMETDDCLEDLFTKTRSGRVAGTWKILNYY